VHYTEKALMDIQSGFSSLSLRHIHITEKVSPFASRLRNTRAKEFMLHGVLRRVFILYRCIQNMFRLFPPDRAAKLLDEDRYDLEINLHCFLINIYGVIENLALSIAYENGIIASSTTERSMRVQVGLFKPEFRRRLNPVLRKYVEASGLHQWFNEYAKLFRDALVHRIPPYMPPSGLDAQDREEYAALNEKLAELSRHGWSPEYANTVERMAGLGKASPFYVHSFSEYAKPVYIHPQLIADFRTIEELLNVALDNFSTPNDVDGTSQVGT
jgi:hypothetical protein